MFEVNKDGSRAILQINSLANRCGYFFNANFDTECNCTPNNGYNCRHPECGEVEEGIGCCFAWSCPLGWEAGKEDCEEFGMGDEYEENEYIVTEDKGVIEKILKEEGDGEKE